MSKDKMTRREEEASEVLLRHGKDRIERGHRSDPGDPSSPTNLEEAMKVVRDREGVVHEEVRPDFDYGRPQESGKYHRRR